MTKKFINKSVFFVIIENLNWEILTQDLRMKNFDMGIYALKNHFSGGS